MLRFILIFFFLLPLFTLDIAVCGFTQDDDGQQAFFPISQRAANGYPDTHFHLHSDSHSHHHSGKKLHHHSHHHRRPYLSSETKHYIESFRKRWGIPGISVAVVATPEFGGGNGKQENWHAETYPFGVANTAGDPVDENSRFAIASNSKLFNAIAVGLLIENKTVLPNGQLLDWSTKAKDVFPDWQLSDPYASDHVDITDLLSMRSGLPRHDNSGNFTIANMRNLQMSAELRQEFNYNNIHYRTLAQIIPILTGERFIDYVQHHLFDKVEMTNTTYNATISRESGSLTECFAHSGMDVEKCKRSWKEGELDWNACKGVAKGFGWWTKTDQTMIAGEGGIISTAKDLTKWLQELLKPSVIPSHILTKIVTPHSIALGWSGDYPEISEANYGFAQIGRSYRGHRVIFHTGSLPGQVSVILRLPDVGLGVAIMINDEWAVPMPQEIVERKILDDLLGLEPINWEERYIKAIATEEKKFTAVPDFPRSPTNDFNSIPGSYRNSGYLPLTLERISLPNLNLSNSDPIRILLDFEPAALNITGPTFATYYGAPFMSHIVFTHFDGNYFNWTGAYIAQATEGNGEGVASLSSTGGAIIDETGIGMFGNFWGREENMPFRHPREGKEMAEVWFDRI